MLQFVVLSQPLIRTLPGHRWLSAPNAHRPPQTVNPLESALPENRRVTPLESALPKSLDLKSFRIRTYKKRRGEGCLGAGLGQLYQSEKGVIDRSGDAEGGAAAGDVAIERVDLGTFATEQVLGGGRERFGHLAGAFQRAG
jgi:hypothetical protein